MSWASLPGPGQAVKEGGGLRPTQGRLGSFFVTLDLVTKADGERGWLAKSLEAQECGADSSQPGVLGWVACVCSYS